MNIELTKTQRLLLCGGLIGLASLMLQACETVMKENEDIREKICGNWQSVEGKPDILVYKEGALYKVTLSTKKQELKIMNIELTKTQRLLLCGGLIGLASLMLQACETVMKENEDIREKICGNWQSVEGKPDILVYKEGALYKVTLFRRAGVHRKLKPETYLLQREADGNLYLNTGFRIDVAYNEETDILSFSPNGDYIRVNTDETANGEKKKEQ